MPWSFGMPETTALPLESKVPDCDVFVPLLFFEIQLTEPLVTTAGLTTISLPTDWATEILAAVLFTEKVTVLVSDVDVVVVVLVLTGFPAVPQLLTKRIRLAKQRPWKYFFVIGCTGSPFC